MTKMIITSQICNRKSSKFSNRHFWMIYTLSVRYVLRKTCLVEESFVRVLMFIQRKVWGEGMSFRTPRSLIETCFEVGSLPTSMVCTPAQSNTYMFGMLGKPTWYLQLLFWTGIIRRLQICYIFKLFLPVHCLYTVCDSINRKSKLSIPHYSKATAS